MKTNCPRCGSPARVLLNLVGCLTPHCRNFESKWLAEWNSQKHPRFNHHDNSHTYLGLFEVQDMSFDLYYFVNSNGDSVCFARYGASNYECYYVDGKQTEIGSVAAGRLSYITTTVQAALKEALRRAGIK